MEERNVVGLYRRVLALTVLVLIGAFAFAAGLAWSMNVHAAEKAKTASKTVYPGKTELDFEGASIEGEVRNPSEFYFQHKPEEKFDSLVKRRKDFHREMMRDAVLSK